MAWLEDFLVRQTTKTSVIISHDSGFLDRVTTNIIHYEDNRKLRNYKGNLAQAQTWHKEKYSRNSRNVLAKHSLVAFYTNFSK